MTSHAADETLTWDGHNQLKRYKKGDLVWRYFYDESGNRIRKAGQDQVRYVGRYLEKVQGGETSRYVYAGSRRIAVVPQTGNNVRYLHSDHLQSSNFITNKDGVVERQLEYAPYGETALDTGGVVNYRHGFTDKLLDGESSLNYFGQRYFIPGIGRWASADPFFLDPSRKAHQKANSEVYSSEENQSRRYDLSKADRSKAAFRPNEMDREAGNVYRYVLNQPLRFFDEVGEILLDFSEKQRATHIGSQSPSLAKALDSIAQNPNVLVVITEGKVGDTRNFAETGVSKKNEGPISIAIKGNLDDRTFQQMLAHEVSHTTDLIQARQGPVKTDIVSRDYRKVTEDRAYGPAQITDVLETGNNYYGNASSSSINSRSE